LVRVGSGRICGFSSSGLTVAMAVTMSTLPLAAGITLDRATSARSPIHLEIAGLQVGVQIGLERLQRRRDLRSCPSSMK
jgi:hypothetical protein